MTVSSIDGRYNGLDFFFPEVWAPWTPNVTNTVAYVTIILESIDRVFSNYIIC